jgi:hypothetical protein
MTDTTFNEDRFLFRDLSGTRVRTIHVTSSGDSSSVQATFVHPLYKETTRGKNLKDFHKRKKAGELLPLTAFFQDHDESSQEFSYQLSTENGLYSQSTDWTPLGVYSRPSDESMQLKADYSTEYFVQAAAAKIYSSGWDSLTFLLELRQTVAMFRNFIKNFMRHLKSGQIENIYLEGRYGWRTLLYDIQDINKMISSIDSERRRFKESVGTNLRETEESFASAGFGAAGTARLKVVDEYFIGLRGTVVADIEPPKVAFNPITTAWELMTLSFVVDWILNVGQWLESMSFLALSSRHYAASGHEVICIRKATVEDVKPSPGWNLSVSGEANSYRKWTLRTPTQVSYNPLIQLRLDGFKVLDLVSLVLQALKR